MQINELIEGLGWRCRWLLEPEEQAVFAGGADLAKATKEGFDLNQALVLDTIQMQEDDFPHELLPLAGLVVLVSPALDPHYLEAPLYLACLEKKTPLLWLETLEAPYGIAGVLQQAFEQSQARQRNQEGLLGLIRLLGQEKSLAEIEAYAYRLLGNPMIITDESYKVLAFTQAVDVADPIWETIVGNAYCPFPIVEMTDSNQFWERLHQGRKALFVDSDYFSPYIRRAVAEMTVSDQAHGYIALLEIHKTISEEDLIHLQMVADVAAAHLAKESAVARAQGQKARMVLNDLFFGGMHNETMAQSRMRNMGWSLHRWYAVLYIKKEAKGEAVSQEILEELRQRLKDQFPLCLYSYDGQQVHFLVGMDQRKPWFQGLGKELKAFLEEAKLYCSAGLLVNRLTEISQSFQQAKMTMEVREMNLVKSGERLRIYSEVAVYSLLMKLAEKENLGYLTSGALQNLREADLQDGSDYLGTLRAYFQCNQSVTATAQALFVHRNTVNYRLGRIREILEDDFDNPLIRLHLQISLLMQELT